MILKRGNSVRTEESAETVSLMGSIEKTFLLGGVCEVSFSKARLKKYRKFLYLPMKDYVGPVGGERLSTEGKGLFPGPMNELEDIVEAFARLAGSFDKLT